MKKMRSISLLFGMAGCAAVVICILTNWSDPLFLPLGLGLGAVSNFMTILANRREKGEVK